MEPAPIKKLLFIFNPHAGKGLLLPHLAEVLLELANHYLVTIHPTTGQGDAIDFASRYGSEYDLIVGSGGDGTLHEIVNGAMSVPKKDRPPIGFIPAGSTNDFATAHEIPTSMADSARFITTHRPHHFDVGKFGDFFFTYVAAFGSFTDVTYDTPQEMKNIYGHFAYIMEGARRFPYYKPQHLKVVADGELIEGDFIMGMVANSTSVGGFKLPYNDINLRDGFFELILLRMSQAIDVFNILGEIINGKFDSDIIIYRKVRQVIFESNEPIAWTLDGEYGGTYTTVTAENLQKAIRFISEKR